MEAMATGLPLVVTNCRGNRDLVRNGENGYVVGIDDVNGFANAIEELYLSEELREYFGRNSLELIKSYSLEQITKEMKDIYLSYLNKK
jgi:glycosyltransferase EpsD